MRCPSVRGGEFYEQDNFDGRSILVRYVWSKITPTSAHFEQAFSVVSTARFWRENEDLQARVSINWVAPVLLFLASGAASLMTECLMAECLMTGNVVLVDGGYTCW